MCGQKVKVFLFFDREKPTKSEKPTRSRAKVPIILRVPESHFSLYSLNSNSPYFRRLFCRLLAGLGPPLPGPFLRCHRRFLHRQRCHVVDLECRQSGWRWRLYDHHFSHRRSLFLPDFQTAQNQFQTILRRLRDLDFFGDSGRRRLGVDVVGDLFDRGREVVLDGFFAGSRRRRWTGRGLVDQQTLVRQRRVREHSRRRRLFRGLRRR